MFLAQVLFLSAVLGGCLATFWVLGRIFPCNPNQPGISRSMGLDFVYCGVGVLYAGLAPAGAALATRAVPLGGATALLGGWLATLPLWAQVAILLTATDFCQYWLHRAFHHRWLWPFHAIHHGPSEVHWTTTFRVHPINYLLYTTSLAIAARLAGFSELAFLLAAPIIFVTGVLAHANLNWTFGPLRWVLVSPVFHRWHHTQAQETRDANFAPMLPVWDLIFGTFRMPAAKLPQIYGVTGLPADLVGQMVHPFRPATRVEARGTRDRAAATDRVAAEPL
jgi:sterol desaturase/sphingolipid hydroxylase (fatty acid hydroxylase superfamily)